ncbi:xanthine dehydrogenase subunit XdhA, partial [Enterocloster asparagiformis]
MKIVGQELKRVDAYGKVTGEAKYTADLEPRDILHGKVVHATIANGRVKSFDLTEAMKVPGVVKIVTCFDAPDCQFPTAGHPWSVESKHQDICDRRVLNERVRLYGDDIAAVVAENEVAAAQAARLIKVEYEEYEPIVTVEAAMAEGATPLHPDLRKDNVIVHSHMTMGDSDFTFDKGILAARELYPGEELIAVEEEYDTPRISHCHIELPVSWAYVDTNGKVTVVCSTQIPHIVRRCTAQALGIPVGQVRIIKPYIGGGFGNKQDVLYEPLNAFLSMSVGGRPVRLEISREETISGTRTRHAIKGKCKGLMTKDGRILARKIDAFANNGAYASHGHAICANCGNVFKDLYRDELGCEVDCWTVYTSSPTAGAMRGYGIPQAVWFAECLTDDLADRIGMDPCEFRLKNCMEEGFVDPANGITFHSYGLKRCIEEGKAYIRWDEKWKQYRNQTGPVRKGVGMAIFCYKTGVHPISLETSSARMVLNQDGSMQLCMGATEIGQGADTVFSQMASETTGISFDKVYIVSTQDTDTTPFDTGAYASRQTYVSGMACKKCGEELRGKILEYAAYMLNHDLTDLSKTVYADQVKEAAGRLREALGLGADEDVTAEMLDIVDSKVVVSGGDPVLFDVAVVADTAFYSLDRSVHITAEVTNHCKDNTFSSGCCFVEVEVDMPLGLVTVKDIVNVHDSGVLINPKTAAAQVHGGMSMGLGYGLSEELLVDEKTGKTLN